MAKKNIEIDPVVVEKKNEMDLLLEEVKKVDYQISELDAMYELQKNQLGEKFEGRKHKLTEYKNTLMSNLRALFEFVNPSETKTQFKVALPSGDVVIKKPTTKLDYDKSILLAWAEENELNDLISVKETRDFKWSDFKTKLEITEHGIINTDTGEIMNLEGLSIKRVEEELQVKY